MPETATEFIQEQNTSESETQQEQQPSNAYPYVYDPRYQPYYYPTPEGMAEYPMMPPSAHMAGFRRGRNGVEMGPYFKPTKQICSIYSMDRTRTYVPRLFPRIDRGFFIADNDWTCYRRNYFQVSASFTCSDTGGAKVELPCLVEVEGRGLRTVTDFQLHITSRTSSGSREVELVQHTAKRDKGPQMTPAPKKCSPTEMSPNLVRSDADETTVVWERIQFKTATANNGKRRAAQQYHILFVELLARCDDGYLARVAATESAPLVVRGRAPGHYAAMAHKEAAEAAENGFPYGFPPGANDPSSPYYHMMQNYYYPPYYANPALWAAAQNAQNGQNPYGYMGMGAPTAEQLAAAAVAAAQTGDKQDSTEEEEKTETPETKDEEEVETAVQDEQDENEVPESSPKKKRARSKKE